MRGDKIRPIAQNLVEVWGDLHRDLVDFCAILDSADLRLNEVYVSLNAAIVLAVLWSLLRRWERSRFLNVTDGDSFTKQCEALLWSRADRWLLCSQWAGRWGSSNDQSFVQYISDLSNVWRVINHTSEPQSVVGRAAATFDDWLNKLAPDASEYIKKLEVDQRQFVKAYYSPIWIWLRLDGKRWDMASIPLRVGNRSSSLLHIDHIVPVKIWETLRLNEEPGDDEQGNSSLPEHAIGNCLLLESSFNISKGKDELEVFLSRVHEFRSKQLQIDQWCNALAVRRELLKPKSFSCKTVVNAVISRTEAIKRELLEYVEGRKSRMDWSVPKIANRQSKIAINGRLLQFQDLADLVTEARNFRPINDLSMHILAPWKC